MHFYTPEFDALLCIKYTPQRSRFVLVQTIEVAQNTYLLDTREVVGYRDQEVAYLLIDDVLALIEPGSTNTAFKVLKGLGELGISLDNLAYIIPTHIHIDHGGGSGYLAEKFPKAKVVLHPKAVPHMKDPSRLIQGTRAVFGENFEERFGPIIPVPENQIHVAVDGEVICLGKRELRIIFSPGHAPHHISIQDSQTRGLFCGEALGRPMVNMPQVTLPTAAPPSFDLERYLESIDKLRNLSPEILYYSHDGVGSDVDRLIEIVKENSLSFGKIVQSSLEAGEGPDEILKSLSKYLLGRYPEADPNNISDISAAGFIGYFRNKNQSSSG